MTFRPRFFSACSVAAFWALPYVVPLGLVPGTGQPAGCKRIACTRARQSSICCRLRALARHACPTYDFAVIGGGAAGLMGSSFAASLGASTVLIDIGKDGHLGGDCTNSGCVPSKALRAAAKLVADSRQAAAHGFLRGGVPMAVDMHAVHRHVAAARDTVRARESVDDVRAAGVEVVLGKSRFVGKHEVEVALASGGKRRLSARRFLIAVGAGPGRPDLLSGLESTPHETYRSIFERDTLPGSLLVVGAGPVGCELAQAYARLGANVTLLGPSALPHEDEDVQMVVREALEADGVKTLFPSRVLSVAPTDAGGVQVLADFGGQYPPATVTLEADVLLLAAGRVAAFESLGLEAAGVSIDDSGIIVDSHLRSVSARHIFAAGDCVSRNGRSNSRYAHHAGWQGFQAVRNALLPWFLRGSAEALVPRVTYLDPEVGVVGLTRRECDAKYGASKYQTLQVPNRLLDRNNGELDEVGFVELRFERPGGRLVGATAVSARGGELASELSLAVARGFRAVDLARVLRPYPSYGFAGHKLATAAATSTLPELLSALGPAGWVLGRLWVLAPFAHAGAWVRGVVERWRAMRR